MLIGSGYLQRTDALKTNRDAIAESVAPDNTPSESLGTVPITTLPPLETPDGAVEVIASDLGYAEFPQVSPDGRSVVFNVVSDYETSQMLEMDSDGGNLRALFTGEEINPSNIGEFLKRNEGKIDEQGTFTRDGKHIYYRSNEKGTFGIGRYDRSRGEKKIVLHDPRFNLKHPVEMSEGTIVGYGGVPDRKIKTSDAYSDIFMANPEKGTYRFVTHSDGSVAYKHPSVMNDEILAHRESRGGYDGNSDIVRIDPATGSEINLTGTPVASEKHPFYNEKVDLITFHSDEEGGKNIWLSTPDGKRRAALTFYGKAAQSPCWSPGGKKIYFVKKLERQPEGEPFYIRQADVRVIHVKKALRDLVAQAKERLNELKKRGVDEALIDKAKSEYKNYRYFLERYE